MRQFMAIFTARTMEFVRDRGTFFWNLLFPIVLVLGFGFAFSNGEQALFKIGIVGEGDIDLLEIETIDVVDYNADPSVDLAGIIERVRRHELDMLIDFEHGEYYVNEESPNAEILERLVGPGSLAQRAVAGEPIRYVDWLVPGVIGMNMMFSCLFGVGFVIVRYRKNGVLKRFKATPVNALTFVSAQAASRLAIVVLTSIVVYTGTNVIFRFMMNGSYLVLLLITTLAILCMIALGLVFASRIKSEELAGGVLNLVTFPMIILSGVFFSLEGSPEIMQRASRMLPLTHFTEGARAVMIEGAGIIGIAPHLIALAGMTAAFLALAAFLFRWE